MTAASSQHGPDALDAFEAALLARSAEERLVWLGRACEPGVVVVAGEAEATGYDEAEGLLGGLAALVAPPGAVLERRAEPRRRGLTVQARYAVRTGRSGPPLRALVAADHGRSGRFQRVSLFLEDG